MLVDVHNQRVPDLKTLQTIVGVADGGSFGAAAAELGLSQQAVSARVKEAEANLGVALFARTSRGAQPTVAGTALLAGARDVLAAAQRLEQDAQELRHPGRQTVTVSASFTAVAAYVPQWVAALHQHHPHMHFRVRAGNSTEIALAVAAGDVGLGVIESREIVAAARHRLDDRVVATDELCVAVPPHHHWAHEPRIDAATLRRTPLIMREAGSGTRTVAEAALGRLATPVAEVASQQGVAAWVRRLGVPANLPARRVAAAGMVGGPVDRVDLSRPIRLVWRRGSPPRGAQASLMRAALSTA